MIEVGTMNPDCPQHHSVYKGKLTGNAVCSQLTYDVPLQFGSKQCKPKPLSAGYFLFSFGLGGGGANFQM